MPLYSSKVLRYFLKNIAEKKNLILNLLLDLGQIKSGKWTRGDRRKNTIVLFYVVVLVYIVGDIQQRLNIMIYTSAIKQ